MSDKVKSIVIKGFIAITLIVVVILGMSYYLKNRESGNFTYKVVWDDEGSDDDADVKDEKMTVEEQQKWDDGLDKTTLEVYKDDLPDHEKLDKTRAAVEDSKEFKDYVEKLGKDVTYSNYAILRNNTMFRYEYDGGVFYVHVDDDGNITRFEETLSHRNDHVVTGQKKHSKETEKKVRRHLGCDH